MRLISASAIDLPSSSSAGIREPERDHAMADEFEQWARQEIARLHAEAETLQRALDKFLDSRVNRAPVGPHLNGAAVHVRKHKTAPIRARNGSKRSFVLGKIGESIGGATTGELFDAVQGQFPDMKRSSLRALLYLEKKSGNIAQRDDDRYVLKQDKPSAPTLGLSQ
jgi:hypothetical protein